MVLMRLSWVFWLVLVLPWISAGGTMRMENLNRGVVAVRTGNASAYVGWRLLGTDPSTLSFNLYRSANGGSPLKLNASPLTASTNFNDTTLNVAQANEYFVKPVTQGVEGPASAGFTLPAGAGIGQYLSIPLLTPPGGVTPTGEAFTYSANDLSVGDFDGDGSYEYVVKWDPSNAKDNSQAGYTGNVLIDAYRLNGTRLWRIDLGRNIRAGAHYTQFIVYDLDSDGRAEMAVKTAPGTIDGAGVPVLLDGHSVDADHRSSNGYVLSGPEYLTIFDGLTGSALATTPYVVPRHPTTENPTSTQLNSVWGDGYGNRVDRFNAAVAYLDGERPSLIMARGYYTRTAIAAWDWRDRKLTMRWIFDTHGNAALSGYAGQGNHQVSVADVDQDGRQEIVFGAMTLNDDGKGLYTTRLGHGDALHVGDFDPARPGLEVFSPFESPGSNGGIGTALRDAATGSILWSTSATADVGRGVTMDIDPRYAGAESWATNNSNIFSATGQIIAVKSFNMFHNFGVWWDADPLREMLDGTTVSKWNHLTSGRSNLLLPWQVGAVSNNGTKSTPGLSGDVLGDWREEVIYRNTDSSALLVFTTTNLTSQRLFTFMHDPQYRVAIAWQNVGYNQPPHPSFFVGNEMEPPALPDIRTDSIPLPRGSSWVSWTGSTGGSWDVSTINWQLLAGNRPDLYQDGDSVKFGDGAATGMVSLAGELKPASVLVDSSGSYQFTGPGYLTGGAILVKSGGGTLTVDSLNTHTGGTRIQSGTLVMGGAAVLGGGSVSLLGGTLATGSLTVPNAIAVDADSVVTGGNSGGSHGLKLISGSAVLTAVATNVFDFEGSMSGFNGKIVLGGTGSFRLFGSSGSSSAEFDLGTRSLNARSGSAFSIGALSGQAGSVLQGASGTGNNTAVTYTIGGKGTDTGFAGAISNGNAATSVTKAGNGMLTLSGTSGYSGATTVTGGTLLVTGSLGTTSVTVRNGGGFGGTGTLGGALSAQSGSHLCFGVTPTEIRGLTVAGPVTLSGTIGVRPTLLGGTLRPGTYEILKGISGPFAGTATYVWEPLPGMDLAGTFDTSVPGVLKLTLISTVSAYEQWTMNQLEGLGDPERSAPTADVDGDGLANLLEYAFALQPLFPDAAPIVMETGDGRMALKFRRIADPSLTYEVEASEDLSSWTVIWSSSGGQNVAGEVTVSDVEPMDASVSRFLRVRVSR